MCELLGMNCFTPTDICFSFTGFVKRGGITDEHTDGWGISFYEDHGLRTFLDTLPAARSKLAAVVREYPIKSLHVLAHIRKANIGAVALRNTQPFCREMWGRYWSYIHNGDLYDYREKAYSYYTPVGDTDSEAAFCAILNAVKDQFPAGDCTNQQLLEVLQQQADYLSQYGIFNAMLSDGRSMFVYKTTHLSAITRAHPFAVAQLKDESVTIDFTQVTQSTDKVTVIATHPLTTNERWIDLPCNKMLLLQGGAIVNL